MKKTLLCLIGAAVAVTSAAVAIAAAKNVCDKKRKKVKFTECEDDFDDDFFDSEEEFVDYTCQCGECPDDECSEENKDEKEPETDKNEASEEKTEEKEVSEEKADAEPEKEEK